MFGAPDNPQWRVDRDQELFVGTYRFEIGKVGLDSRGGWIAFANTATGYALVERFRRRTGGRSIPTPARTSSVGPWAAARVATLSYDETSGPFLMETEVLSPFRDIAPGAIGQLRHRMERVPCAGPILDVTAAGCVSRRLTVTRSHRTGGAGRDIRGLRYG